jgi:spore maturation protein CgeB
MVKKMSMLLQDPDQSRELAEHGRATILGRHTCAHRVKELYTILEKVGSPATSMAGGVN